MSKLAFKTPSSLQKDLLSQAQTVALGVSVQSAIRLVVVVDGKNTLDRAWREGEELSALFSELSDCFPRAQEVEVYALSGKGTDPKGWRGG